MSGTVLIRCDSSQDMGVGHISRCSTLASEMRERGLSPRFACRPLAGDQRDHLRAQGFDVVDLDVTSADEDAEVLSVEASRREARWILLDHPTLGIEYERAVRRRRPGPLAVIDGQFRGHDCELLINPNIYADPENCRPTVPSQCEILAGYRYFLLRDAFRLAARAAPETAQTVLLTLGGADPENLTLEICRQLALLPVRCRIDVVIGPANRHAADLGLALAEMADRRFQLHRQPDDFADMLARCTVCVSAGGITMGECAYLGKPVIALIIAENQRRTVEHLARIGAAIQADVEDVGSRVHQLLKSPEQRNALSGAINGLVDGGGASRVVHALLDGQSRPHSH